MLTPHRIEKQGNRSPLDRQRFSATGSDRGNGGIRKRSGHGEIHPAGSIVRESGIYEVLHDGHHRSSHEVVMIAKDHFPTCESCEDRVRYRVVRTAPYIFSDEDFEETK